MAAGLVGRQVAAIFAAGMDADVRGVGPLLRRLQPFRDGGDPVALGLVASLNRPTGNATAVTVIAAELMPKRMELLRELIAFRKLLPAGNSGFRFASCMPAPKPISTPPSPPLVKAGASALLRDGEYLFITSAKNSWPGGAPRVPAMYDRREFPAAVV
jgi:putative ABC transport system substrate-binding protein